MAKYKVAAGSKLGAIRKAQRDHRGQVYSNARGRGGHYTVTMRERKRRGKYNRSRR